MIHAGHKNQKYGLGCWVRCLNPVSSSYGCINLPQMDWNVSLTPALYNLCKLFRYMEFKRNKWDGEEREVVDIFREGKFELLTFTEMKLKGNGEVSWCGVYGIIASVQEMERASEGMAIKLNNMRHSAAVADFGHVNSRILWIKFQVFKG